MHSSGELSAALVECLKEVSSLLGYSFSLSQKQRDALVANDAEEISITSRAQEEILRRISEADQRASAVATQLAEVVELDPDGCDSHTLAKAAGYPYNIMIEEEMTVISSLSEKVRRANEVNEQLLKNGLEIITCCLRTIANDPGPSAYSKDANFQSSQAHVLSLDLRV